MKQITVLLFKFQNSAFVFKSLNLSPLNSIRKILIQFLFVWGENN